MSTEIPFLQSVDHKVIGKEFSSGYSDSFGHWNTGFYCPQSESKFAISCCGTSTYKYCCWTQNETETISSVSQSEAIVPFLLQTPLLAGVACGIIFTIVFILIALCYYFSCCLFYQKSESEPTAGLYRVECNSLSTTATTVGSSSASSGNIYSGSVSLSTISNGSSSSSSAPQPLLIDVQSILAYRDFLCGSSSNLLTTEGRRNRNNNNNHQSTHGNMSNSLSTTPSSANSTSHTNNSHFANCQKPLRTNCNNRLLHQQRVSQILNSSARPPINFLPRVQNENISTQRASQSGTGQANLSNTRTPQCWNPVQEDHLASCSSKLSLPSINKVLGNVNHDSHLRSNPNEIESNTIVESTGACDSIPENDNNNPKIQIQLTPDCPD